MHSYSIVLLVLAGAMAAEDPPSGALRIAILDVGHGEILDTVSIQRWLIARLAASRYGGLEQGWVTAHLAVIARMDDGGLAPLSHINQNFDEI